jgi:carbon-monoxide dehydrogenase large subunit
MIANAVEDALGIRIKSMPITKEKVALAVLKK